MDGAVGVKPIGNRLKKISGEAVVVPGYSPYTGVGKRRKACKEERTPSYRPVLSGERWQTALRAVVVRKQVARMGNRWDTDVGWLWHVGRQAAKKADPDNADG